MTARRVKARTGQQTARLKSNWRYAFLERLAETSNVSEACRVCGAEPSLAYRHRRVDPDFRKRWDEALLEGYEHLELETLQRLRFGTGPDDVKFDIPNALRLLTAHRESVAREKARRGKRDRAQVLDRLNAKLDKMRERKAAAEKLLAEDGVMVTGGSEL